MVRVRDNLNGRVFGRLLVISQVDDHIKPSGRHESQWLCECSCEEHNRVVVMGSNLKSGHTQSCGCLQRESVISKNKDRHGNTYKLNLLDEYGSYGIGYCSNTKTPFYFDMDDYDKIKDFCWHENVNSKSNLHTLTCLHPITKKPITMHQLLGYKWHDHIDKNELNNRKHNLRPCTFSQNSMNRSLQSNNTSGITGVSWDKDRCKWRAYIKLDGKYKTIGRFDIKEDAVKARLIAEIKYFGEFAPQQHLYEQYGIKTTQNDYIIRRESNGE